MNIFSDKLAEVHHFEAVQLWLKIAVDLSLPDWTTTLPQISFFTKFGLFFPINRLKMEFCDKFFSSCCNFSSSELSFSNPHSQQQYSVYPVLKLNVNTISVPSFLRVKSTRLVYFPQCNWATHLLDNSSSNEASYYRNSTPWQNHCKIYRMWCLLDFVLRYTIHFQVCFVPYLVYCCPNTFLIDPLAYQFPKNAVIPFL